MALEDGRALPAGRLAEEAGVSASTVSNHLSRLLASGLVTVEQQGRHRYYRLASPHVAGVLEAIAQLAPSEPISSLREHTRARALRDGRTCYNHLAGRVGVRVFEALLSRGWITGGDGLHRSNSGDRLSAPGHAIDYRLTAEGVAALPDWGVPSRLLRAGSVLRYCVDWTEQAHHLSGPQGTALTAALFDHHWIERGTVARSVVITAAGQQALAGFLQPE